MTTNHKLNKFKRRWERALKLSGLAKALDDAEDSQDAFAGYYRNFLSYIQTEHEDISGNIARQIPVGDPRLQLAYAKVHANQSMTNSMRYGLDNLGDILDDFGDDKLLPLALGAIPIKQTDMDRAHDLEGLIKTYENDVDVLRGNLESIDPNTERERYETQKKIIEEHKEYASVLKKYKGLVENILGYQELQSYVGGVDMNGREMKPDLAKMRELVFSYWDNLLKRFKGDKEKYDANAPVIETLKYLAGNPEFLRKFYDETVLRPAEEKLTSVAKDHKLKEYIERNIKVSGTNKQIAFLSRAYELAKEDEHNSDSRIAKLYGLRKAA